ncbi:MAG: IS3 family transposase [Coriobacteriia bacterium]|nr:IS3 family transposase [Coriobacteriia bacterium]MCL2632726.1 IS3 family transposase [Coriobacteriia bacterium]
MHWFNNIRIHSTLGYLTPVEFREKDLIIMSK